MDTEQLAQLIAAKRQLLLELLYLARQQAVVVREQDLKALMTLLAAKQRLLAQMQQLQGQLAPFREQDPEQRVWSSPTRRAEVRVQAEDCERLLAELVRIEQSCEGDLIRRRDDMAERLQGLHGGQRALQGYFESPPAAARLDLCSET